MTGSLNEWSYVGIPIVLFRLIYWVTFCVTLYYRETR